MEVELTDGSWHLDKRVPIALIMTVLLQTLLVVWFLAAMRFDLTNTMDRLQRLESDTRADRVSIEQNRLTAAVTNASLSDIKASLTRIEDEIIQGRRDRERPAK